MFVVRKNPKVYVMIGELQLSMLEVYAGYYCKSVILEAVYRSRALVTFS